MAKELLIKDNTLINASYTLSLTEQRLLLLSIVKAQKSGVEITHNDYISIHANEFVEAYNVNEKSVYSSLKDACTTLFRREFSYRDGKTLVQSHWLQSSKYNEDSGSIEILFAKELIPFISQLKKRFTSYYLQDVAQMTSVYAIRLYELIIAWKSTHKTPIFEIDDIRLKLGVESHEYPRMYDFKRFVIDIAISQINELSNIQIELEQHKKGRSIVGFSFTFVELKSKNEPDRDPNTVDWVDDAENSDNDVKSIQSLIKTMADKGVEKKKRKVITEAEASAMAKVGESWEDLRNRLKNDYYIKFDK